MGHMEDRCDILDILEEAVVTKRAVTVDLLGDRHFTDLVTDVVTEAGQDFAFFKAHGRWGLNDIRTVSRAQPHDQSYKGKSVRKRPTEQAGETMVSGEVPAETTSEATATPGPRR